MTGLALSQIGNLDEAIPGACGNDCRLCDAAEACRGFAKSLGDIVGREAIRGPGNTNGVAAEKFFRRK